MKIDKIKNYNQILLAIAGTTGCVLLLCALAIMLSEIMPQRNDNTAPHGLLADEKAEMLNQENLRKQVVSYESPWLVDTVNSIYMIPVSISTLKKPEEVMYDEYESGLLNMKSGKGYYSRKHLYGTYANLIVYDPRKETAASLFHERLVIGYVNMYHFKDDILVVFSIASTDTNKNGIIDLDDSKDLCIYSMNTGELRKISQENNDVSSYEFIENSKDMLIQFRLGQYQPNQFNHRQAPGIIMKYDYATDQLLNVVPQEIQQQMQKLVEGK